MDGCWEDALCCGASEKMDMIGMGLRYRCVCASLSALYCSHVDVEPLLREGGGRIAYRKSILVVVRQRSVDGIHLSIAVHEHSVGSKRGKSR